MPNRKIAALALLAFCWGGDAAAQSSDVCAALVQRNVTPGLYLADTNGIKKIALGQSYDYDAHERIFAVIGNRGLISRSQYERAFVVKSRTFARQAQPSQRVRVSRPRVQTACLNGAWQEGYRPDEVFIDLKTYIDHHSDGGRADPGLGQYFHFSVNDQSVSPVCFRTDDVTVVRNREKIFLFEKIVRGAGFADRSFGNEAHAAPTGAAVGSGLMADLIYVPTGAAQCFQVSTPLPTYPPAQRSGSGFVPVSFYSRLGWSTDNDWADSEALHWRPSRSLVEVRALTGAILLKQTIMWNDRLEEAAAHGQR